MTASFDVLVLELHKAGDVGENPQSKGALGLVKTKRR